MTIDPFPSLHKIPAPYIKDIILRALPAVDARIFYYQSGKSRSGEEARLQIFALAEKAAQSFSASKVDQTTYGGAHFVALNYELGYLLQGINAPNTSTSISVAQEVSAFYVADTDNQIGMVYYGNPAQSSAAETFRRLVVRLISVRPYVLEPHRQLSIERIAEYGELNRDAYKARINSLLADINSGRFYEVNLTQRFSLESKVHPRHSFHRLYTQLRARHSCYFEFGTYSVIGSSPELLLECLDGSTAVTAPIKGSFSKTTVSQITPQLKAEHTMVVDLARNDLGRICQYGTVAPEKLFDVESFGGLSHLVTRISGTMNDNTFEEKIQAVFPGASITGAPKIESMIGLAELETSSRDLYTGSCGYVASPNHFSLNVAIRTLTAENLGGQLWRYRTGAGGAIIADASPEAEYLECLLKAQPLLSAVIATE